MSFLKRENKKGESDSPCYSPTSQLYNSEIEFVCLTHNLTPLYNDRIILKRLQDTLFFISCNHSPLR